MKSFLKFTLASVVGFLITGIILIFIVMGIIAGVVASAKDDSVALKKKTVLTLDLSKGVIERSSKNHFE